MEAEGGRCIFSKWKWEMGSGNWMNGWERLWPGRGPGLHLLVRGSDRNTVIGSEAVSTAPGAYRRCVCAHALMHSPM